MNEPKSVPAVTIGPAAPSHLPSVDGVAALLVGGGGPGLAGPNKKDECFAADKASLRERTRPRGFVLFGRS